MRLPYPRWACPGDLQRPVSVEEAIGILAGFSAQVEVHKVLVLTRYASQAPAHGLGWEEVERIYRVAYGDLAHISILAVFGDPLKPLVRVSSDLDYALGSIAEVGEPSVAASITLSAVVPAYIAILDFIARRTPIERVRKPFTEILESERRGLEELLETLSERFDGEAAAETLEERAVVLFATAGAEDPVKISIASIARGTVVSEEETNKALGELYRAIDSSRAAAAEKLYRGSGKVTNIILKYGLSGFGLC